MSKLAQNLASCDRDLAQLEAALAQAKARAQETGAPVLLSYAVRAPALDLLALFTATSDPDRFLFEKPARGVGLLGFGAAARVEADATDAANPHAARATAGSGAEHERFASIRAQAAAILQNGLCGGEAAPRDVTPKFVGGFAFTAATPASNLWSAFPPARFILPEIQIHNREDESEKSWILLQQLVGPETDLEKLALQLRERHAAVWQMQRDAVCARRDTACTQPERTALARVASMNPASVCAPTDRVAGAKATALSTALLDEATLAHAAQVATLDSEKCHSDSAVNAVPQPTPQSAHDPFADLQLPKTPREPSPAVREHYLSIVRKALAAIEHGELEKVVVARSTALFCRKTLDPRRMLTKLRAAYPGCTLFAIVRGADTFLGATPECLVALEDGNLHIDALAGSAPRGATPEADAENRSKLETSLKERHEHALVVRSIRGAIAPLCETLQIPDSPRVLALDAIQHLHSPISGRAARSYTVLDFVEALHPTAAIAGAPRENSKRWLAQNEELERGWYSGPIGWFDANGNGDFSVALRCALLKPTQALFFAGAGIVADSDPEQELEETRLKLRASLLAFLEIKT